MTIIFGNTRLGIYVVTFALTATVLGIVAKLANLFLPNIHHDFTIFSLIVPSLTIFVFLLLWQWSQPRIELPVMFVLAGLWLAMGAWSADIIGPIECFPLAGTQTATKNGEMSAQSYCYQMKVIEAFSWMIFVVLAIYFLILIALVNRAIALGRRFTWYEDILFLPWFSEYPGYQQFAMGQQGYFTQPMGYQPGYHMQQGGYVVNQNPGHSVVIHPGMGGQPPTITQIPGSVSSV